MTRGARKEGLSRRHRFTGRGAFAPALESPRKVRGASSLLHLVPGRPGQSRLGLSIPKRLAPHAVQRNRLKRLARELFRRHPVKALGHDLVLTPRKPIATQSHEAWAEEFRQLLDRAMER